ncbi:hypothetical protein [Deinococcus peraridilitoris]|uniref:Uncharacterized protein n=1 Tax=Deinococcus peraridilitoris (strain DSM 19664 / LMG 22246 / CIP 109416 / KR-200) TaxID=937777 RepID=L0A4K0_DEIPD|nr:hypothetical protein [Deinococcus peraridilitoris]AFZ67955.1 hypothetical protein Deipe_2484 [Deinococcus peraridilitoris DSM 19664]
MWSDAYSERAASEVRELLVHIQRHHDLPANLPRLTELMHTLALQLTHHPSPAEDVEYVLNGGPGALDHVLQRYRQEQLMIFGKLVSNDRD